MMGQVKITRGLGWIFAVAMLAVLGGCGEPPALQAPGAGEQAAATTTTQEGKGAAQATDTSATLAAARAALPKDAPKDAEIVTVIKEPGRRGGQLVVAIAGDPKTFNTLRVDSLSDQFIDTLQIAGLYSYDWALQKDIPGLAKSWEYDEAKREWTFHVREGLKWSDGAPLTADDFVFFTELAFDPNIPNDFSFNFRLEPKADSPKYEFSAPDPLTLKVKIPGVDSFSWINLGQMRAMPRHALQKAWKAGQFSSTWGQDVKPAELVVSGPFKLKEFRPGQAVVFERNPHYWRYDVKGQQLPYVDRLVLLVVQDLEAQEIRFLSGDLDILDGTQGGSGIKPDNLANFQDRAPKENFTIYPLGGGFDDNYFCFNTNPGGAYTNQKGQREAWKPSRQGEKAPAGLANYKPFVDPVKLAWFSNPEFRIACSELTNRKRIIDTILFGQGTPLYNIVSPADVEWCNPKVPQYPYNPESAKKRLEKLGFIDRNGDGIREDAQGRPIRFAMLTNRENNVREKIIQILRADFLAAGVDLQPEIQDFNTLTTRLRETFDYDAFLMGMGTGVPPHPAMGTNVYPSGGRLHYGYSDQKAPYTPWEAEIDKLYNQMKLTFDVAEQVKIFGRIQEIFAEQQPAIHLYSPNVNVAARNRIGGLRPAKLRGSLTYNIDELYIKGE